MNGWDAPDGRGGPGTFDAATGPGPAGPATMLIDSGFRIRAAFTPRNLSFGYMPSPLLLCLTSLADLHVDRLLLGRFVEAAENAVLYAIEGVLRPPMGAAGMLRLLRADGARWELPLDPQVLSQLLSGRPAPSQVPTGVTRCPPSTPFNRSSLFFLKNKGKLSASPSLCRQAACEGLCAGLAGPLLPGLGVRCGQAACEGLARCAPPLLVPSAPSN